MHYYPHHIGDFIKETANLNDHQLATYLRMIWAYYLDEKPFDNDCESIAFAVRSDEKTVHLLLKHYFELIEDKWHQKRCDREIEHYKSNSEKGRKAAEARWNKHNQKQQTQSEGNADAMHMHTKTDANAMVFNANQEPRTKNHNVEQKTDNASATQKPNSNGSRLPDGWRPSDKGVQYCKDKRPDLDVAETIEAFCDYWRSVPGAKGRKVDWELTWKTWVRTQRQTFNKPSRPSDDLFAGAV